MNRKTVAQSMRRQGLEGVSPRRFRPVTTIPGTRTHSIPDLCQRHWDTGSVDAVWITDITYLRTKTGWVYLCGIKDACSRKIVSTAMSTSMTTDLVEEALRRARTLRPGAPGRVVIHSDRGAQFTSEQMYRCCQELTLDQSMGSTGVCWDNAMIESQWSVLKSEFYDRYQWDTPSQAIKALRPGFTGFTTRSDSTRQSGTKPQSNSRHVSTHRLSQKRHKRNKPTVRNLRATPRPRRSSAI